MGSKKEKLEVFEAIDTEWAEGELPSVKSYDDFITHLYFAECSHKGSFIEELDFMIKRLKQVRDKAAAMKPSPAVLLDGEGEHYLDQLTPNFLKDFELVEDKPGEGDNN